MPSPIERALNRLWAAGLARGFSPAVRIGGGPRLEFDPDTPEGRAVYREVGERITNIRETTRQAVRTYVARNRLAGGSGADLAKMIRDDPSGAFSAARARMIARTESGTAFNRGSVLGYRQSGRVSKVRVYDGDGCGWESHDDPQKADGMIVDLDEVAGNELAHPNCRRAFAPVVDSDE